jgi:hypothetical protein
MGHLQAEGRGFDSIAPTNLLSYQYAKRPFLFHSEHLFQLIADQCAPSNHAGTGVLKLSI